MALPLDVSRISGPPETVGAALGARFAIPIREYTLARTRLCAVGTTYGRPEILDIAERMLDAHEEYDRALFVEMVAMADAAGITPAEAVIVGGYTDFIDTVRATAAGTAFEDTCTAVITPDAVSDGAGFLAQTWDMHASATPHVFLLDVQVDAGPRSLVFTTHGTLGQIGMNDAGIAIGINNLTVTDGAFGVTWPFVVRKALRQTTFDEALACITDAPVAGGHSFLLLDADGNGAMVEATPTATSVTFLCDTPLVHTNHCLTSVTVAVEAERPAPLVESSDNRIRDAVRLMGDGPYSYEGLVELLSDESSICRHPDPEFHYESSGAVIMRPRTGDFWAAWGLPSQNAFEHFRIERSA
jgi:isopenicillin-N N-acyltransferase-like protein